MFPFKTLRLRFPYMQGTQVRDLQERLIATGFLLPRHGADGIFGPETERSVKSFQKSNGLNIDGVVGPETWERLYRATGSTIPNQSGSQSGHVPHVTQTPDSSPGFPTPDTQDAFTPPTIDNGLSEMQKRVLAGAGIFGVIAVIAKIGK